MKNCVLLLTLLAVITSHAAETNAVAELAPVVVWGARLRMGEAAADDSLWRGAPPALAVRSQSEVGALTDISINGSAFSEAGVIFNGAALTNPQTEHFNADLSCPSDWLETPRILTGLDLFRANAGHSAGSLEALTAVPSGRNGRVTVGAGLGGLYFTRANALEVFDITSSVKGWAGAFIEAAHADRIDGYKENDLDRMAVGGRFGMAAENWMFDTMVSFRWRDFGTRGAYGYDARPAWEANNQGLVSADWRYDAGDDQASEISVLWSRADDTYRLDRVVPSYYENKHTADQVVLHGTTRRHFTDELFIDLRGDTVFEVYDTNRKHNYSGASPYAHNFRQTRVHGSYAALPGVKLDRWEFAVGAAAEFYSNYDAQCNPAAGITYFTDDDERGKIALSYREATRQPSFTELTYEAPTTVGTYDLPLAHTRTLALDYAYQTKEDTTLQSARAGFFLSRSHRLTDWLKTSPSGKWTATALRPVTFFGLSGDAVMKVTESLKLMVDGAVTLKETDTDYYSSRYVMDYPIAALAVEARWEVTDLWSLAYRQGVEAWKSNPVRCGRSVRNVSRFETTYKMPFCRDFSLSLGVSDLFDQAFEIIPGQKMMGITGYLAATYSW